MLGGESTEDKSEPAVDDGIDSCKLSMALPFPTIPRQLRICNTGTQKPTMYAATINNQKILLLDTPGFDDSGRENLELLDEIVSILYVLVLRKSEFHIHGIVFLHDISEVRFSGSQRKTLSILRELCGEKCMGNVVVGTTRWSLEKPARFKKEEEREQKFLAGHWGGIHGTRRWIEDDDCVPLQIVTELLAIPPVILQAQEEMLKPPHTVGNTTVGKSVIPEAVLEMKQLRKEFSEREKKFEKEMARNNDEAEALREQLADYVEMLKASAERDKKKFEQLLGEFDEKVKELAEKEKKIKDDEAKMRADAEKQKNDLGYFDRLYHKVLGYFTLNIFRW